MKLPLPVPLLLLPLLQVLPAALSLLAVPKPLLLLWLPAALVWLKLMLQLLPAAVSATAALPTKVLLLARCSLPVGLLAVRGCCALSACRESALQPAVWSGGPVSGVLLLLLLLLSHVGRVLKLGAEARAPAPRPAPASKRTRGARAMLRGCPQSPDQRGVRQGD